jgi:transposase-like protein
MAEPLSPSSPFKDSSPDSPPASPGVLAAPDANAARDAKGHFTQAFKLAAVRYAAACGKSQRAAALDIGISDGTLGEWSRDARPIPAATATAAGKERASSTSSASTSWPSSGARTASCSPAICVSPPNGTF